MSISNLALPPSRLRKALIRCLFAGLTPIVTSSPGIGKSDIVKSIAKEYRLKLIDFRVPQADVTDFNGLPFPDPETGKATFRPFDVFPLEGDSLALMLDEDGKVQRDDDGKLITYDGWLIFLDELTSAPKHLQSPAYKLILDRMVGNQNLHPRVVIAAAGNEASDNAIVHELSTALQSRLIHLGLKLDHKEWMDWAIHNGIDSRILAFLQFKPELLHRFDPNHDEKTFACPRTWSFASRLTKGEDLDMEDLPLLAGTVSPGVAQEYISFIKVFDELPKMQDILDKPDTIPVPHEPSIKFALATVLAEKMDEKTAPALCTFLTRMPVECRVLCLRMVRQRNPHLMRNASIQKVFQPILARM